MASAPHPVRRPLVGLACSVVLGTAWGLRLGSLGWPLALASVASVGILAGARLAGKRRRFQALTASATHLAVVAAAACSARLSVLRSQADYRVLKPYLEGGEEVLLLGTVASEPAGYPMPKGGARIRFEFKVHSVPDEFGGPQSVRLPVQADWYGPTTILGDNPSRVLPRAGEGWALRGRLREVPLLRKAPLIGLDVRPGDGERRPAWDAAGGRTHLWELRRSAAGCLVEGIREAPRTGAVLKAMLLGYRSELPHELRTVFADSGTIHIFAISGLHVGIVATLLTFVLPLTRLSKPHWALLIIPFLVLYTIVSGGAPSAQRSCVMAAWILAAPLFGRKPDAPSSLAAAAILILAVAPLQLLDLGMVFSFACVVGLLTIAPFLKGQIPANDKVPDRERTAEDLVRQALLASSREQEGPVLRFLRKAWRWARTALLSSLTVSMATWIASAPLTAMYFGRFTPVSILSNLVAVPLAFLIVVCGALSLVAGLLLPGISATFNSAAVALVELLVVVTHWAVRIPGGSFPVTPWPAWTVAVWYGSALLLGLLAQAMLASRANRKPPELNAVRIPPR